jgi:hypothetical protein
LPEDCMSAEEVRELDTVCRCGGDCRRWGLRWCRA